MPRAIVFDLGNTLWFEAHRPSMVDIFREQAALVTPLLNAWKINVPVPIESVAEEVWGAYLAAWDIESERGRHREPSLPFLILGALASHGIELSDEQASDWWRAAWVPVSRFGVQLYPDVLDVLRELKAMGLRIGVNSNRPCTADMLLGDLEDMHLASFIDAAVCSGDTGYVKPHPSTFMLIAERLELPPSDIAMVGDICERDCAGGKAAGMTTVLKLNGRYDARPCADADFTIHDLGELLALPLFGASKHAPPPPSPTPHDDENEDRY